jgi:hypothetical protein
VRRHHVPTSKARNADPYLNLLYDTTRTAALRSLIYVLELCIRSRCTTGDCRAGEGRSLFTDYAERQ